jgi:hypothetical protein
MLEISPVTLPPREREYIRIRHSLPATAEDHGIIPM